MPPSDAPRLVVDRTLLVRAGLGLVGVLAVAGVCGVVFREPITVVGALFIERFGWAGVFAAVVFTDASPLPLTHEPVLLMATAGGRDPWTIGLVASAASVAAGPVGWLGGRLLQRVGGAQAWIDRRTPGMSAFLREWGATGVAIAALLPIPFSLSTWTAGLSGVPFWRLVAASLLRIPKTAFYLWLIVAGWSLGG